MGGGGGVTDQEGRQTASQYCTKDVRRYHMSQHTTR